MEKERIVPEGAPDSCPGIKSEQAGKVQPCSGCPHQPNCALGNPNLDGRIIPEEAPSQCPGTQSNLAGHTIVCSGCPHQPNCASKALNIHYKLVPDNAPSQCPGTLSQSAGKVNSCQGCPNQQKCNSGEQNTIQEHKKLVPDNAPQNCPGVDSQNASKTEVCTSCPHQPNCALGKLGVHGKVVPVDAPEQCPGTQAQNAGQTPVCSGCPHQPDCAAGKQANITIDKKIVPVNANTGCVGTQSQQAGTASSCAGCPNKAKCSSQNTEEKKVVPDNANEGCPGTQNKEAGKMSACQGCPNQQICASGKANEPDPALKDVERRMKLVKHKILVLSGKGGVGKSTVSSQLAFQLANLGYEVGLLDIDICGPSIPRMLGLLDHEVHNSADGWSPVYVEDNLGVMSIGFLLGNQDDAVVWRGPRKNGLIKQFLTDVNWGDLDYLIIDTPPGTSDEHISCVQYLQPGEGDGAIVVTTPQEVSLQDVRKELSFCQKTKTNILGVVENMSGFICPGCKCESQIFPPVTGGAAKMCQDYKIDLLGQVPLEPKVLICSEKGKSIVKEHPDSVAAKVYQHIAEKVTQTLKVELPK
ncbi:hypothetical protein ABPG72_004645 [Tetrahymena utriculariae]